MSMQPCLHKILPYDCYAHISKTSNSTSSLILMDKTEINHREHTLIHVNVICYTAEVLLNTFIQMGDTLKRQH